jgi:uncharacterized membrane protein
MDYALGKRFWEIDLFRGIAVILMVVYHLVFMLVFFDKIGVDLSFFWWVFFQRLIATLFILIVGISLTLSNVECKNAGFWKNAKRGIIIFLAGMIVTLATWLYLGSGLVVFGVLHLIGVSIIIAYPFLKLRTFNAVFGASLIVLGVIAEQIVIGSRMLIWLGIRYDGFYSVDYFPLLPWFGIVLFGIFFGNTFYLGRKRRFNLLDISSNWAVKGLCFAGRHALLIYLTHIPLITAILLLVI